MTHPTVPQKQWIDDKPDPLDTEKDVQELADMIKNQPAKPEDKKP